MSCEERPKDFVVLPNDYIKNVKKGTVCTHPVWGRCIKKSTKGSRNNNGWVTILLLSNTEEVGKKNLRERETKLVKPNDKVLLI